MLHRSVIAFPVFLMALLAMTPAFPGEKHLLLGIWAVEVSKLTMPQPPRSVTIALAEVGDGIFKMTVDIVSPDGSESHAEGTFKPDGSPAPARGSLDVDIVSMTMPSRRILVMGAGMAGNPSNTRVFSLSDDGKHMIETIVSHGPDGTPYTRVNTWNRK
jgi:hypothetical protein